MSRRARIVITSTIGIAAVLIVVALVATAKAQNYRNRTGEGLAFVYVIPLWVLAILASIVALVASASTIRREEGERQTKNVSRP